MSEWIEGLPHLRIETHKRLTESRVWVNGEEWSPYVESAETETALSNPAVKVTLTFFAKVDLQAPPPERGES